MSIRHHPDETTLIDYATDALDDAANLVVASHVALCADCRKAVRTFECLGGSLLASMAPGAASAGPVPENDLAAWDETRDLPEQERPAQTADADAPTSRPGTALPAQVAALLAQYPDQDWKWLGPGIRWKPLINPGEDGIRTFLLKAQPGTAMPQHRHEGIEWTQVLTGAFAHEFGRYGPGDFDDADETLEHRPIVERGGECICIVAMKGQLQLQGLFGRLMQPFVRF